ncbi:MAG: helix-turn-helix transcriptional regulator, partial [Blautia sp.]|nr:helix-turn-helix transcriptional regulator [Blautia sp.]
YSEEIGRNEIGAAFYLVPEYVAKLYKKKTGKALKDAINDYRLTRAKTLLMTSDRKVSEIAQEVGFDNFSYFSTLFKKSMGMTPNEFRKQ